MDENMSTEPGQPFCRISAHRFQSLGDNDGQLVFVVATSVDATLTTLSFDVSSGL